MLDLNEVLVPLDLSDDSETALRRTLPMLTGDQPVMILLHVIEPKLVRFGVESGLGNESEVIEQMRSRAVRRLDDLIGVVDGKADITPVICEGTPFYEIAHKAEEFDVDAVVLSKRPPQADAESLFFGSTAERVVRACRRIVIVLPAGE